jgi:NAD(P)-dependent dehydrogenase (short-subunit alcohol dehydrogenase family)
MLNGNRNFEGKVALITRGENGIGRAAALAFAHQGAHVVTGDVSDQGNQETARMVEELGVRALPVRCDVTRAEEVKSALDRAVDAFGGLDFAFNNAGSEQAITATADLTVEEWDRIVRVNLRSVFLCMKYEIPLMLTRGRGVIVNTSSGARVKGIAGQAAYCAAKHDVIGLTKAAALDCAPSNIRGQRRVPRDHRHADDGSFHRRQHRGAEKGDLAGAGWTYGKARGNRCGRPLALFRASRLRRRACARH